MVEISAKVGKVWVKNWKGGSQLHLLRCCKRMRKVVFSALCILFSASVNSSSGSESPQMAIETVNEMMQHKQYESCLPILTMQIRKHPNLLDAYALRGVCYLQMENYDAALSDFDTYFESAKEPIPTNFHRSYGLTLCQFKKFPQALEHFTIDVKREPKNWNYWYDRAQLYATLKQYDKAIDDATIMLKLRPEHYRFALRAKIYYNKGDYEKAAQDWTTAIKLSSGNSLYYEGRAKCYEKMGKTDLAKKDRAQRDNEW